MNAPQDPSEPPVFPPTEEDLNALRKAAGGRRFHQIAAERNARAAERRTHNPNYTTWSDWGLHLPSGGGPPLANLSNAISIIQQDANLRGIVRWDAFLERVLTDDPPREWSDKDDIEVAAYMQSALGIHKIGVQVVAQAVLAVAHRNTVNCVTNWFDTLDWDGTERIGHFFPDHFGAEDTEYTQAASRNFWLCLVARAYRPGCKVDNMIVLEGEQGAGKSTALQIVGGAWFAEQHESATNPKGFAEILQGKLLVEISEMDAFNRAEVNRVKQTVSCPSDRYRAAYARYAIDNPRTCIFVGTTNKDDWNRDETGARRFWPIRCQGAINAQAIRESRAQCFAEAVHAIKAGAEHWQMPEAATREQQQARFQFDPWHDAIASHVNGSEYVTTRGILEHIGMSIERQGTAEQMRVGKVLRVLGWQRGQKRLSSDPTASPSKVYLPPKQ